MVTAQDIRDKIDDCVSQIDALNADKATGVGVFEGLSEANFIEAYTLLMNQRISTWTGEIAVMIAEYAFPPPE